jgi:hypothetical protein
MRTAVLIACLCFVCPSYAQDLPEQISDADFWQMVSEFSETGGSFNSDNFVSNETLFQRVVPNLKKNPGGAYIGVGPDQNFTYLVAIQPRIAFIIDIRRQAMLQHLMYKAIIELSGDRADFLSRLFSRNRPANVGADSTAAELLVAYYAAGADAALFDENLKSVLDRLSIHHGFSLSEIDRENIEYVYSAFFREGPDLAYSKGPYLPTYAQLMQATDGHGENQSYLGSEANFQILRNLETSNLVIPVVGDFAGSRALRSVADYLKDHHTVVSAFYTSNVEQYLFQQGNWRKFYLNVSELPVDVQSTFIRWIPKGSRQTTVLKRNMTALSPISDFLKVFMDGEIRNYRDVLLLTN